MLDTDEQGDQNIMTTIEMETYRSQRSATSGNMERQGSSTKQTISNSKQIDRQLNQLGGKVKVNTKYDNGRKVTMIKIKSNRKKGTTNHDGEDNDDMEESLKDVLDGVRAKVGRHIN